MDKIAVGLATFIATAFLMVALSNSVEKRATENGFMTIDGKAYRLIQLDK